MAAFSRYKIYECHNTRGLPGQRRVALAVRLGGRRVSSHQGPQGRIGHTTTANRLWCGQI